MMQDNIVLSAGQVSIWAWRLDQLLLGDMLPTLLPAHQQKAVVALLLASISCLQARGGVQLCGLNPLPKQLFIASRKRQQAKWAHPLGHKSDLAELSQRQLFSAHSKGVFQYHSVRWGT